MESSTILTADVLDIIFEGRNKDYGAYDLRRSYNRRLKVSITVMLSVICMLSLGFVFAGKRKKVDPAFIGRHDRFRLGDAQANGTHQQASASQRQTVGRFRQSRSHGRDYIVGPERSTASFLTERWAGSATPESPRVPAF